MRSLVLLLLFLALCNALDPCCTVVQGTYDEAATAISSTLQVDCADCSSSLTSLAVFPQLSDIQAPISFSCTNCSSLATFASFPALENSWQFDTAFSCVNCPSLTTLASFPALNLSTASFQSSASCSNCPSLTSFASFPSLEYSFFYQYFLASYICSSCPSLATFASFPVLATPRSSLFSAAFDCSNCTSLTTFALFPNLIEAHELNFTCSDCPSLITFASLPTLAVIQYDKPVGSSYERTASSLACTNCISLTTFVSFPMLVQVGQVFCSCSDCPLLTTFASFTELEGLPTFHFSCHSCSSLSNLVTFPAIYNVHIFEASFACSHCPSLTTMVSFPAANTSTLFGGSFSCSQCPSLTTLVALPVLTQSPRRFSASFTCSYCPSLTSLGDFPAAEQFAPPVEIWGIVSLSPQLSCIGCHNLVKVDIYPFLNGSEQIENIAPVLSFRDCPKLESISLFAQLGSISAYGSDWLTLAPSVTCVSCDSLRSVDVFSGLSTVLLSKLELSPSITLEDCGATELNVFTGLGQLNMAYDDELNFSPSITAIASNVSAIHFFANLESLELGHTYNLKSAFSPQCLCDDCPSLASLQFFTNLASVQVALLNVTIGCSSCPMISDFSFLPSLKSLVVGDLILDWTCASFSHLQNLKYFPSLEILDSPLLLRPITCTSPYIISIEAFASLGSFSGPHPDLPTLQCSSCPQLTSLSFMSRSSAFHSQSLATVVICDGCPELTQFDLFGNLTVLAVGSFSPTASCTSCPKLERLGHYPLLVEVSPVDFLPSLYCTGCSQLTGLGNFPALKSISSDHLFNPLAVTFAPSVRCISCPQLVTLANFGSLADVTVWASNDASGDTGSRASFQVQVLCEGCSSLFLATNFSSLEHARVVSNAVSSRAYFELNVTCINCTSLLSVADLSSLSDVPEGTTAVSLVCEACPSLVHFMPPVPSSQLHPEKIKTSFSYVCTRCPSVGLSNSGSYRFSESLPELFSVAQGVFAGIGLWKIHLEPGHASFLPPALTRITSLSLEEVSGTSDAIFLANLRRIDGTLEVRNCPNLTSLDGLVVSLTSLGSLVMVDNPLLCPSGVDWLSQLSTTLPVVNNNGFGSDCEQGVLRPVEGLLAVIQDAAVLVNWTLPSEQLSNAVKYTLTMNFAPIFTFFHYEGVTQHHVVRLPAGDYVFAVSSSYGQESGQASTSFTLNVGRDLALCPPGEGMRNGNCVPCTAGTFSLDDACHPCPAGTFSEARAYLYGECQLCPAGTFNGASQGGVGSCVPCTACPAGSLVQAPPAVAPENFTLGIYSKDGNLIESVQASAAFGLYYLVAFLLLSAAVLGVGILLRKRLRTYLAGVAVVLRTPATILRVVPSSWTLVEIPSSVRGLVGLCAILGVLLISFYQIHVYAVNRRLEVTALQPGTSFGGMDLTSGVTSFIRLRVKLAHTQVQCESAAFAITAVLDAAEGVQRQLQPQGCTHHEGNASMEVFFSDPAATFGQDSRLVFKVTASNQPVFAHGIGFDLTASTYEEREVRIAQGFASSSGAPLSAARVEIAAVPTEYVRGQESSRGYTFSYASSSTTPAGGEAASNVLSLMLELPAPAYYYQIRNLESITFLQFVVGVFALATAVLSAGSIAANISSILHLKYRANKKADTFVTSHSSTAKSHTEMAELGPEK